MGKTPKPLRILLTDATLLPHYQPLLDKGHEVVVHQHDLYDLVMGPQCWRMNEDLVKYLELAIKGARMVKYPKKGGKDAPKDD